MMIPDVFLSIGGGSRVSMAASGRVDCAREGTSNRRPPRELGTRCSRVKWALRFCTAVRCCCNLLLVPRAEAPELAQGPCRKRPACQHKKYAQCCWEVSMR